MVTAFLGVTCSYYNTLLYYVCLKDAANTFSDITLTHDLNVSKDTPDNKPLGEVGGTVLIFK